MSQTRLIPTIIQDGRSGRVLMLGYQDEEARRLTEETGLVHFHSRSRDRLWKKGETSGNTLTVVAMAADCDQDAVLIRAVPAGPTCHTGSESCFGDAASYGTLGRLMETIEDRRRARPAESYTVSLIDGGPEAAGRKVVEEAVELLLAAKDHAGGGSRSRIAEEAADVLYHLLVVLAERGLTLDEVWGVLEVRAMSSTG